MIYTLQRSPSSVSSNTDGEGKVTIITPTQNKTIRKSADTNTTGKHAMRKISQTVPKKQAVSTTMVAAHNVVYCSADTNLNDELKFWHTEMQRGNSVAQIEIDRRLFACTILEANSMRLGTMPIKELYLDYCDTVHMNNIPDLIWVFRDRLRNGVYYTALQDSIFRYSIPCIRKSKHPFTTKLHAASMAAASKPDASKPDASKPDASKPATDHMDCLCSVYINVMYGTLLGLYPHCSKTPTFKIRKKLFCALYTLSIAPQSVQEKFICQYINLMRLCFMEYFVYVIDKFCNVERNLMCKCLNYDIYTNLCQTSSDLFRQNCLQGDDINWANIDMHAFKTTDKIIRTTRIGIKLSTNPGNIIGIRKLGAVWSGDDVCVQMTRSVVLDIPPCFWHQQHMFMYTNMITQWLAEREIEFPVAILAHNVAIVHQMIHVYRMPTNFAMKQVQALLKYFEGDYMLMNSICKKTICLRCIMNIKQACNAHTVVNNTRMCLDTCALMCNKCNNSEFLITINMLGKWLQVERHMYYICPHCIEVHCWLGTGTEFISCCEKDMQKTTVRKTVSTRQGVARGANGAAAAGTNCLSTETLRSSVKRNGKRQYHCYVCKKQCNNINMSLLRVNSFDMQHISLCSKHYIPMHFHKFIMNTDHINRYYSNNGVVMVRD
jgi:hypothetical protein